MAVVVAVAADFALQVQLSLLVITQLQSALAGQELPARHEAFKAIVLYLAQSQVQAAVAVAVEMALKAQEALADLAAAAVVLTAVLSAE